MTTNNAESLKETIRRELPALLQEDPVFRAFVLEVTKQAYPSREETNERFDRILDELRRSREELAADRKEQTRKWDEQNKKWNEYNQWLTEQSRRWDETNERLAEQSRRWDEHNKWLAEDIRRWEEQSAKWHEQDHKWEESVRTFDRIHDEIMAMTKKHDRTVGALGARWGLVSEAAFRNALAGILEENFAVEVMRIVEFDDEGKVFGRPEQVELDIIVTNGLLLICELKSSIEKAGMYIFERKARFYEEKHGKTAKALIVISPMIDPKAQQVADKLGIRTYTDSLEVERL